MVRGLGLSVPGCLVLDIAAGTGSITRLLARDGHRVVGIDLSASMLAHYLGGVAVLGRAEELPFSDEAFDALTFGYLLRYTDDPTACLRELARVLRPGGVIGMVEFGLPARLAGWLWRAYTRSVLPLAGRLIGSGWAEVGSFLGADIDDFHRRYPKEVLTGCFRAAGLVDLRSKRLSLGGGLVMWARRP
jgi:demethylmenaquinone methyltransferase/2-methoxy-6-polyprenyl-1,4-benzoquinol methylase